MNNLTNLRTTAVVAFLAVTAPALVSCGSGESGREEITTVTVMSKELTTTTALKPVTTTVLTRAPADGTGGFKATKPPADGKPVAALIEWTHAAVPAPKRVVLSDFA